MTEKEATKKWTKLTKTSFRRECEVDETISIESIVR